MPTVTITVPANYLIDIHFYESAITELVVDALIEQGWTPDQPQSTRILSDPDYPPTRLHYENNEFYYPNADNHYPWRSSITVGDYTTSTSTKRLPGLPSR